jgi:hypothetical protein
MKTKPFQYREITGHWWQKHDEKNLQNEHLDDIIANSNLNLSKTNIPSDSCQVWA